jgi:hypothetical protein
MSGMMDGMGMDMSSAGMFQPVNKLIARSFWYIICSFIGVGLLAHILYRVDVWLRYSCSLAPAPY